MNISIPEALKKWAEAYVAEGNYASTSDLVRDLLRREQARKENLALLQAEIDKGLASGVDPRSAAQILRDIRSGMSAGDD